MVFDFWVFVLREEIGVVVEIGRGGGAGAGKRLNSKLTWII